MKKAVSLTLDKDLLKELEILSREAERPKSWFINLALKEFLEEIKDAELALRRKKDKRISLDKLKTDLKIK